MRRLEAIALCVTAICAMSASLAAPEPALTVFAATSLTSALREAADTYTQKTAQTVTLSFAGSSVLASRLEAGETADVFVPADASSMDYVEKRALIDPKSRRNLLGNRLVLIARADNPIALTIAPRFALSAALGTGHLAIPDPDAIAAGRYARYALISLGLWNSVTDRVIKIESIRATVSSVAGGEAAFGIVYETDTRGASGVRVVDVFPASSHPRIVYPIALTSKAKTGAARFAEFLGSAQGRRIFARYGFRTE
jgi:molybdate transport system substrate-binding protein